MLRTRPETITRPAQRLTAETGTHCPLSGLWAPNGEEAARANVLEGSIMPTYRSDRVQWTLLKPFRGLVGSQLGSGSQADFGLQG